MMADVGEFTGMIMDLEVRDSYSALAAWDLPSLVHFCPVAAFIFQLSNEFENSTKNEVSAQDRHRAT
jgi:hypothetical protein